MSVQQPAVRVTESVSAFTIVTAHLAAICYSEESHMAATRCVRRMIDALPEPLRGDIPHAKLVELMYLPYEEVEGLCKSQVANNRPLCAQLYPILMNCDLFPIEDTQVIRAKEVAVVLLTELTLLSQLVAATDCDSKATTEESGVTVIGTLEHNGRE